jgi:cation:H+ antiporter
MEYLLLILGFILLIKGADMFVEGASNIAKFFKIPTVIIGLTLVAFGTSAPEAAVSITAAINGNSDIAISNIVGSCIFNLFCVLGITALFKHIIADKNVIKKDYKLSIFSSLLLLVLILITTFLQNKLFWEELVV